MVNRTMTRGLRTLIIALVATFGVAATSPAMAECAGPMCMVRSHCGSTSLPMAPRPCCMKAAPQAPAVAPAAHLQADPLMAMMPVHESASPLALASPLRFERPPTHGHRTRPLLLLLSTLLI